MSCRWRSAVSDARRHHVPRDVSVTMFPAAMSPSPRPPRPMNPPSPIPRPMPNPSTTTGGG